MRPKQHRKNKGKLHIKNMKDSHCNGGVSCIGSHKIK